MKNIGYWVKDYIYLLKGKSHSFFYFKAPKHYRGYVMDGKCPVVLLPGISERWTFMKSLADAISLEGYPVYVLSDLKWNTFSIPYSAGVVMSLIDENGLKDAIIVAHSKGGLIGKYLMAHFNTKGKVKGMVAIAAPFSGSSLSKMIPHKAYRELLPGSDIIRELDGDKRVNKRIISIMPDYDNHVWHENGSRLDGAMENIILGTKGHHKILFDKKARQVITEAIDRLNH